MARTHFQGDLLFTPSNIQGWEDYAELARISDREITMMRRGIDATLLNKGKTRFYIEEKIPPCMVMFYFDVLSFNRNYTGCLNESKSALIVKLHHNVFGFVNLTIPLSSAFGKGCVITKIADNGAN